MRTLTPIACALALAILAGCGSMSLENKRVDYKAVAVRAPSLEVPPDLTVPAPGEHYTVPEDGESASFSDYAKNTGGAASGVKPTNTVLPATPHVHMERNGAQRWLVVDDKAENIWPSIKAFFQENGLPVKTENPQAGVMETDWAENRANIPKTGLRSLLGKVFDGLYDSGEKDMFRVRLERTKDGNGTEIYLTHYGIEEVLNSDKSESRWQDRPSDPDLEAAMLQMLAVKLGGVDVPVTAAGAQPVAQNDAGGSPPQLQKRADDTQFIVMNEAFDKSWRKVGLALERAKFTVTDKNRARGIYYIRADEPQKEKGWLDKLAFWKKDEEPKSLRYQVQVREVTSGCEVTVRSGEGTDAATAQRIIESVFKALGQ